MLRPRNKKINRAQGKLGWAESRRAFTQPLVRDSVGGGERGKLSAANGGTDPREKKGRNKVRSLGSMKGLNIQRSFWGEGAYLISEREENNGSPSSTRFDRSTFAPGRANKDG